MAAAKERGVSLIEPTELDSPTGKGVIRKVDGKTVALGAERYLDELGIATPSLHSEAERLRADGVTAIYVAIAGASARTCFFRPRWKKSRQSSHRR